MAFQRKNYEILNAIRNEASNDYQRRIPAATKADQQATQKALMENTPQRNEFFGALLNRIGLVIFANDLQWDNPLRKFNKGVLPAGNTIEEVAVGLAQAYTYDPDREYLEEAIFGKEALNVQSAFHKINRENFYKVTVNRVLLQRAFDEGEYGLSSLVAQIMSVPATSDAWDEFLLTTALFRSYYDNGGFFKVNVPDVSATNSDEAASKALLRSVRGYADKLPFLSTAYNALGMPVFASKDKLELFVTPEVNAAMDVEALAAAFNIDRAALPTRTTVIPQENFNIPGAQAILTTRDFFVIMDTFYETTQQVNPVGLHENYFLHHHQIISYSPFVPAILFTTEPGDVINVTPTPVTGVPAFVITDPVTGATVTDVVRGSMYYVTDSATTNPANGFNNAVRYTVTGDKPLSDLTYLHQTGALYVGLDEDSTKLTITAIATDDNTLKYSEDVDVDGAKLTPWPNPNVLEDTDSDSLLEVTPKAVPAAPTTGANKNKVKIPSPTEGYDYKDGATVVNGQDITLTANKTITAVPQAGYEIKTGATASWNLVFTA